MRLQQGNAGRTSKEGVCLCEREASKENPSAPRGTRHDRAQQAAPGDLEETAASNHMPSSGAHVREQTWKESRRHEPQVRLQ